jgi:hypothetical protein
MATRLEAGFAPRSHVTVEPPSFKVPPAVVQPSDRRFNVSVLLDPPSAAISAPLQVASVSLGIGRHLYVKQSPPMHTFTSLKPMAGTPARAAVNRIMDTAFGYALIAFPLVELR